jgi:hypothetical protein
MDFFMLVPVARNNVQSASAGLNTLVLMKRILRRLGFWSIGCEIQRKSAPSNFRKVPKPIEGHFRPRTGLALQFAKHVDK